MSTHVVQQDEIRFAAGGGRVIGGSLALPDRREGPGPALVVLHEILGLNEDIRRLAARFTENGYITLAPDLFEGRGPLPVCIIRALVAIAKGGGSLATDVVAARDWLAARDDVDETRVGVVGFCLGGSFALLVTQQATFAVAAPFYGGVQKDIESVQNMCPIVGSWGAKDRVFASHGRRLKAHLESLGVPHDVEIYEDAGHSFMSQREGMLKRLDGVGWLNAAYDDKAAEDSWRRMLAFFATHL